MSEGPYEYEGTPDPADPVTEPDDQAGRGDIAEATDYINPGDPTDTVSPLDTSWDPPDRPPHNTDFGTTLTEEREGESLDRRLAEEQPDVLQAELSADPADADVAAETDVEDDPLLGRSLQDEGGDTDLPAPGFEQESPRAGRLVEPDEGAHPDTESELVASDVGISGGAASAEEAAMHVVDEDDEWPLTAPGTRGPLASG